MRRGISIGSERIGNKAPLTFAFATIAPIIVEQPAIPIPEFIKVRINMKKKEMFTMSKNIRNIKIDVKFTINDNSKLNINLPKKRE